MLFCRTAPAAAALLMLNPARLPILRLIKIPHDVVYTPPSLPLCRRTAQGGGRAAWPAGGQPRPGGQQRADDSLAEQPDHGDAAALQRRPRRLDGQPVHLPACGACAACRQRQQRYYWSSAGSSSGGRPASTRHAGRQLWRCAAPSSSEHVPHSWHSNQCGGHQRTAAAICEQHGTARQHRQQRGAGACSWFPQQLLRHPLWRQRSGRRRGCWHAGCSCRTQPGFGSSTGGRCAPGRLCCAGGSSASCGSSRSVCCGGCSALGGSQVPGHPV